MTTLTETEETIAQLFPATSNDIEEKMGYSTKTTIYDHISNMRDKGVNIVQDNDGTYYMSETETSNDGKGEPTNTYAMHRQGSVAKQTITRKANQFFAELEQIVKPRLDEYEPPVADGGLVHNDGNIDLLLHVTDTHIGDVVKNKDNEVVFNTEEARNRINKLFKELHSYADELELNGVEIDTVHVLLGGDIVTNEVIYDGQPWDIDSTIKQQIQEAVAIFDDNISKVADRFPSLQIICQNGNHGEFRVDGSSTQANADDFVYSILDYLVRKSDYDNITIVKDEQEHHTNFEMRDGQWIGHLRHGQQARGHIGTSSPRDDWQAWQRRNDFDIGFYGHYHEWKLEPLPDGTPVIMGGSIKPPDEYAESMAKFSGPMCSVMTVTDEEVMKDIRFITF